MSSINRPIRHCNTSCQNANPIQSGGNVPMRRQSAKSKAIHQSFAEAPYSMSLRPSGTAPTQLGGQNLLPGHQPRRKRQPLLKAVPLSAYLLPIRCQSANPVPIGQSGANRPIRCQSGANPSPLVSLVPFLTSPELPILISSHGQSLANPGQSGPLGGRIQGNRALPILT